MLKAYQNLLDALSDTPLAHWAEQLPAQIEAGLCTQRYGDLPAWQQALARIPPLQPSFLDFTDSVTIGRASDCDANTQEALHAALAELIPWRKGPYHLYGIHLDTEWRSDWKWDRVNPHLAPLEHRLVLDVGCGNGYHCWRMLGAGAQRVIGIDPSPRFVVQFQEIGRASCRERVEVRAGDVSM